MGAEQLQGTPWHPEQMHKTCKEGSKYCIYNSKGKCAFCVSDYYKKDCTGKGACMKKLFLLLITSLFLLSGCSQKSNKISVNNPYEIAKGTSVLSYYDTEDNINIEGFTILECTPHNVFWCVRNDNCNCIIVNNGMIRCIHIVDEDIITYKGISVGDSIDKIENSFEHERKIVEKDSYDVIFNNNIEEDPTNRNKEDTWIVIDYSTDGSKITSIEIFDVLLGNRLE